MPRKTYFKTNEDFLEWYRQYREKNKNKLREYRRKYNKEWRNKNGYYNEINSKLRYPEKERVRRITRKAVNKGIIKKLPCEICKSKNSQAHHEDYTKPLEIIWLCPLHHREADERIRKQNINK